MQKFIKQLRAKRAIYPFHVDYFAKDDMKHTGNVSHY